MAKKINKKEEGADESAVSKAIVWLKVNAYVSDKERLNVGLYAFDVVPERFYKLSKKEVEVFADGEVPSKILGNIGKWAGISNAEEMDDEALLEVLVKEPVPYL